MRKKLVRLAATQWSPWRGTAPREIDPYGDAFSFAAAERYSMSWTEGHAALLEKAGELGADLAVTGEDIACLSNVMTYLDDRSLFRRLAESTARHAHTVLAEVARRRRMHVVGCFFEPEGDAIFNVSILYGRDGRMLGRYRKVHLPAHELWQVTPGNSFPAFETDIGPVAMLICYDAQWPESTICSALNGARIICHSTAASQSEHRMRTRAEDAQAFYVTSTHTDSAIVGPDAQVLANAGTGRDTVVIADADIQNASLASPRNWDSLYTGTCDLRERHLKLRRTEAYAPITDRHPTALNAYPEGKLATTPEAVEQVYEEKRADMRRAFSGKRARYSWRG
jgi:predicted amidohydrolase